jgi:predicted DsbA family dithiol-disulfide isomerase
MNLQNKKITIDIVSDVVCPWCYVGKKRLESALAEMGNSEDVVINWYPFQLDPTIPEEGVDREKYFIKKFGDPGKIRQMFDHLTNVGKEDGIDFQLDMISKSINTFSLHKLLHVAGEEGVKAEAEEIFFKAYFTEGKDLSEVAVLTTLLSGFGWDEEKIKNIMSDDSVGYAVRQEISHYQGMGVSGVPFFVVNNKYGISGAQPSEVFIQALSTVRDEMLVEVQGEVCGPEGC